MEGTPAYNISQNPPLQCKSVIESLAVNADKVPFVLLIGFDVASHLFLIVPSIGSLGIVDSFLGLHKVADTKEVCSLTRTFFQGQITPVV